MTWSLASTTSRSAVPLPWAIHAPEHARMTGSRAVTSPLAGRDTSMRSPRRAWIYGSRLGTTRISSPRRSSRRMVRRASGDQVTWLSSRARYSDSMSRISARRSLAMGRSSGSVAGGGGAGACRADADDGHVRRPLVALEHLFRRVREHAKIRAADLGGEGLGRYRRAAGGAAKPEGIEAFVFDDLVEHTERPGFRAAGQRLLDRIMNDVGDQVRAHVDVAREPPKRQPVHQRHDRIGDGRQGQRQGNDEAQGQPQSRLLRCVPFRFLFIIAHSDRDRATNPSRVSERRASCGKPPRRGVTYRLKANRISRFTRKTAVIPMESHASHSRFFSAREGGPGA